MNRYEKIIHWIILLSFLGLCSTALAAEYFFSKEAILDSFKNSLPMIGVSITPADQFFISRIARRDTWDIHLYFGLAFSLFLIIWLSINFIKKNKNNLLFKTLFFTSAVIFCISGIWMWLRLYIDVSEDTFNLLKKVHYYAYWSFIYTLIIHVISILWLENTKKRGILSNMVNFKNIFFIALFINLSNTVYADEYKSDLEKWANDDNYINGVLYLEGEKGADIILKEISNCPYEKCKLEDIENTQFGTKTIEIKKPDYKKAIQLLEISSNMGNVLASEKLLKFLIQRIDYKSKNPSKYLLNLLKEDTGLTFNDYKILINKILENSINTNKSCTSEFLMAEIYENGLLDNRKDNSLAKIHYKRALEICPRNNINFFLTKSKLKNLNKE